MPNWCNNRLEISGDPEEIQRLQDMVERDASPGGLEYACFDFNQIIPMPDILARTACRLCDDYEVYDESGVVRPATDAEIAEIRATGYKDWYFWSIEKWGTKWNAKKPTVDRPDPGRIIYTFSTAWSPPEPVLRALSAKFPGLEFDWHVDEEGGFIVRERCVWKGVDPAVGKTAEFLYYDRPPAHVSEQWNEEYQAWLDAGKPEGKEPQDLPYECTWKLIKDAIWPVSVVQNNTADDATTLHWS